MIMYKIKQSEGALLYLIAFLFFWSKTIESNLAYLVNYLLGLMASSNN